MRLSGFPIECICNIHKAAQSKLNALVTLDAKTLQLVPAHSEAEAHFIQGLAVANLEVTMAMQYCMGL